MARKKTQKMTKWAARAQGAPHSGDSRVRQLSLKDLRQDGGTQPRVELDRVVIHEYARRMKEGDVFPPVIAFFDGEHYWLADGFHRVAGANELGEDTISAEIRDGTQRDALLYAVGANATHGLPRSNADKRRAVALVLADKEGRRWSDRRVAKQCAVSPPLVASVREELTANGCQSADEEDAGRRQYVTRHGTVAVMNTSAINVSRSGPAVPLQGLTQTDLDALEGTTLLDPCRRQELAQLEALDDGTRGQVLGALATGRAHSVRSARRVVAEAAFDANPPLPLTDARLVTVPAPASSSSVVIDLFAGAGSTGVAAVRAGRHFVGVELHEQHAAEAAARLRSDTGVEGSLTTVSDLTLPAGDRPAWTVIQGDAVIALRALPSQSAQTCITSPPYWGARSYGTAPQVWGGAADCEHAWEADGPRTRRAAQFSGRACLKCGAWFGELGHEPSVEAYVEHLVFVFGELKRVLREDGTLWLNMGDAYAEEALVGVPWLVAFALQRSGWLLRRDVVWARGASGQRTVEGQVRKALGEECVPEATQAAVLGHLDIYVGSTKPESVENRPAGSHEYLFLLVKSSNYLYDGRAVREASNHPNRGPRRVGGKKGLATQHSVGGMFTGSETRNLRSVWLCPTSPYRGAHVAPFPPELVRPCVEACTVPLASSDVGLAPAPAQRPAEATPAASPHELSAAAPTDVLVEMHGPGEVVSASPASESSEAARCFVGVVLGRDGYTGMIDSTGSVRMCSPVPTTLRRGGKTEPGSVARLVASWAEARVEEVVFDLSDDTDLAMWTGALEAHGLRHSLAPADWRGPTTDAEAAHAFPDHLVPTERSRSSRTISYPKVRALLMARFLMLSRTGDPRRLELEILGRKTLANTRHITPTQGVLAYLDKAIERGVLDPKTDRSPLTSLAGEVAVLVKLASNGEFEACWRVMRMAVREELDPEHMDAMRCGVLSAQEILRGGLGRPPARATRSRQTSGGRGRPCA